MSRRQLGTVDGAALVVATVVGSGIFVVPPIVARLAGSGAVAIALWVAGGCLALVGALCYAELASRFPRGGAEYVYIREAFGATAGFLSGWTSFIAGFSGAIAAAAVGFAASLPALLPSAANRTTPIALGLIALFTAVSIAGLRASRVATNALAILIVIGIATIAFSGLAGGGMVTTTGGGAGFGALSALVPIFFTYSGWNAAAYLAGDFRDPTRTVPRALVAGTVVVTLLYVAVNAGMIAALSTTGLSAEATPVTTAARLELGAAGSTAVSALVLVALASSVCAMVITGPRIYVEMARDGALPPLFAIARGRDRVPIAAVLAQSAWSTILVLTGTFEQIVMYTGFAILVFSGLAVMALFVSRRRHGRPATFRVPAYPLLPAAFLMCVGLIAAASFRYAPGPSIAGLALIGVGIPVHIALRRRRPTTQPGRLSGEYEEPSAERLAAPSDSLPAAVRA